MSKYSNLVNSALVERIEEYIENNHLISGDSLPPEREFCTILNVSRMTLRDAIRKLCEAGILLNIQGKGTFLAPARITRDVMNFHTPAEEYYKLLSIQKVHAEGSIIRALNLSTHNEVYQIKRIRMTPSERISIETSYIPVSKLKTLDLAALETVSMPHIYGSDTSQKLSQANIKISVSKASFEESEWLGITEGDYVTVEKHTVYCDELPIEHCISVSSAHRVKYSAAIYAE